MSGEFSLRVPKRRFKLARFELLAVVALVVVLYLGELWLGWLGTVAGAVRSASVLGIAGDDMLLLLACLGLLLLLYSIRRQRELGQLLRSIERMSASGKQELAGRRRAEEALGISENRLRDIMDSMLEGCQIIGTDWRYRYVNDSSVTQNKQPREAMMGRTMMEAFPGIEQSHIFGALRQSMEERIPVRTETAFTFADGSTGWFDVNIQPVTEGVFVLSHDISAQKRSSAKIQTQLEQLEALRTIDIAIVSGTDIGLTLRLVVEQVTRYLHVDAAAILLLDPLSRTLTYGAGRGFHTRLFEGVKLRVGEGYAGVAVLERRMVQVLDIAADPERDVRAPLSLQEGFVTYVGMPLIAKGSVQGVLNVYHRSALQPDGEWLGFLETLAGQTAIAINNAELFDGLQRSNLDLSQAYDTTLDGWSRALDMRDKETEGHTLRVADLTLELARAMKLDEAEQVQVRRGALLHDIGKMGIPDRVLLKPEPLSDEEWAIMRMHPQYAYELLSPISYLRPALDIPYCHHEKWDGTGYPRGLKGEQIPLTARMFAVVDVWDALRSDRPYRAAWPVDRVREQIRSLAGTHFDPKVVDAFLGLAL